MIGHFVPFLIEKLSAKQIETKLETIELLSCIAQNFSQQWLTEEH